MDLFSSVPQHIEQANGNLSSGNYLEWEKVDIDWWRMEIVKNYSKILWLGLTYLVFITFGPTWMKSRESFRLKKSLVLWNSTLAVFSFLAVVRTLPEFIDRYFNTGLHGVACKLNTDTHPQTSFWVLAFLLSKIIELGDTAFLILNKRRLIFLHWWHHLTVLVCGFYLYPFYEPYVCIGTFLNCFVHSFMYSYYAFMAAGFKIPKQFAMSITTIQLAQFAIFLMFNVYVFLVKVTGGDCFVTYETMRVSFGSMGSYFLLFIVFFKNSYFRKNARSRTGKSSHSTDTNDKNYNKGSVVEIKENVKLKAN